MKSERRHELQTNELADWLGHRIEDYRPYLKTTAILVLGGIVLSVAYLVVSQRQASQAGQSWEAYFRAVWRQDPSSIAVALDKVAKSEDGVAAGLWARQTEADVDLEEGAGRLFRDRDEALRSLERAEKNYLEVEKHAQAYPQLMLRARYGLAQALECQGKLEKAKEKYEQVAKADATGSVGKLCAQRLKAISAPGIAEFYDWFQRQTPAPLGRLPGTDIPPLNLDGQPDKPDLDFGKDRPFGSNRKPFTPLDPDKPESDSAKSNDDPPADQP